MGIEIPIFRPTVAEIDLSALQFNVAQLQKKVGPHVSLMAIVKANAYGHGDVLISQKLEKLKVPFLAVAYIEEGIRLRTHGIQTPILVLTGGQDPKTFPELHAYQLTPVFYHLYFLKSYNDFCKKKNKKGTVHLKFDTGMNRLGFTLENSYKLFKIINKFKNIKVEGLMTHFANAERHSHYNQEQILLFRNLIKHYPMKVKYTHMANSGAILNDFGANENMVRPGLALYGAYPTLALKEKLELKPVMTLKSQIIQLKKVKKGDFISYGYTHRFAQDSVVATIPVGYADGFFRYASNKADVLIRGKRAPIVGVLCMDVMMVDVGQIPGVCVGDEVILIGKQKKDQIRVEALAERIQTIPWEIFCHIGSRVPRVLVK